MLRIPDAGRIEDRTVDGSCNPYLAATAILASGLDGMAQGLEPGDPTSDLNLHDLDGPRLAELGIELLPENLLDATRALERDDVLREALGPCGHEVDERGVRAGDAGEEVDDAPEDVVEVRRRRDEIDDRRERLVLEAQPLQLRPAVAVSGAGRHRTP